MQVVHFGQAPLIEVVAELRWETAFNTVLAPAFAGTPVQVPSTLSAQTEEFFGRFAQAVDDQGYRNSERLLPIGAPLLPHQPAMRFRRRANTPPLLQVGAGVFSANGLPPTYSHWGEFREVVHQGIESLLSTRSGDETDKPFQLTVRYINAFGARFWGESSPGAFIEEILGFKPNLPQALESKVDASAAVSASHDLNVTLANGSQVAITVGEGAANDEPAAILNMAARTLDVSPDLTSIMDKFEENHRLIRDMFMEMTTPISGLMEPREVSK